MLPNLQFPDKKNLQTSWLLDEADVGPVKICEYLQVSPKLHRPMAKYMQGVLLLLLFDTVFVLCDI